MQKKTKNLIKLKKEKFLETKDKITDGASTVIRRARKCAHCEKKFFEDSNSDSERSTRRLSSISNLA